MTAAERVPVLMYHRVGEVHASVESRYCVTPGRFAAQMGALATRGYRAVGIDAFVGWLAGGPQLTAGDFVLTFDDGFRGVREHALPVLERLGWPVAIFLVTDLLGGVDAWNASGRHGGGTYPLLTPDEVVEMQARGCSFHSHTRTHASLPMLADGALADQLTGSRAAVEKLLGLRADLLAYPYGHVDDRVEAAARAAGYRAAFSVQPGFNRCDLNPFRIRRLDVFGTDSPGALLRKMRLGSNDGSLRNLLGYYWRQAVGTGR
ncbi:MAG: polysaccharide deacetylase family protein [Rubrivivax sp.]|nr:polysaccharide deacetylase family protein [Rubrivivax sp.]